ncbi:MAG: outer membrane lipid asymmetry maintenance protein MlaD [Coxiellaceae bacterium]|nr:outer membrane lipid asymmetry maintenance protein MlaD [Coxiellaceae bacterium]
MRSKVMDFVVGLFILAGLLGLLLLAFKVSGLTTMVGSHDYYTVSAEFDNVGDLAVRAPVSVSGVTVGRVSSIQLDPTTFRAKVILQIDKRFNQFPKDSSASILTQGLLGSNYISLSPGFDTAPLKQGSVIESTNSALILENLVGQLMYNLKNGGDNGNKK